MLFAVENLHSITPYLCTISLSPSTATMLTPLRPYTNEAAYRKRLKDAEGVDGKVRV